VGVKLFPDFESAIAAMTHRGKVFTPDERMKGIYDRLYRKVYQQMYRKLKPLYEEINRIVS